MLRVRRVVASISIIPLLFTEISVLFLAHFGYVRPAGIHEKAIKEGFTEITTPQPTPRPTPQARPESSLSNGSSTLGTTKAIERLNIEGGDGKKTGTGSNTKLQKTYESRPSQRIFRLLSC